MVRLRRGKHHIAALDVRRHVLETFGVQACLQLRHFDDVLAADIYAAQQGDVLHLSHAWSIASPAATTWLTLVWQPYEICSAVRRSLPKAAALSLVTVLK